MEKLAEQIVYRKLTNADFYNINKPPGAEQDGGGQSYIDFSTTAVSINDWRRFFPDIEPSTPAGGPLWKVPVNSLGLAGTQTISIGQRRATSVSIRSQKLHSRASQRVRSWHPRFGNFPVPNRDVTSAGDPEVTAMVGSLVIYLIKTNNSEYWAGWINQSEPPSEVSDTEALSNIFPTIGLPQGIIKLSDPIRFDTTKTNWPFLDKGGFREDAPEPYTPMPTAIKRTVAKPSAVKTPLPKATLKRRVPTKNHSHKSEEELISDLFNEDIGDSKPEVRRKIVNTINRNTKAVADIKALYKTCQITGDKFIFNKRDGSPYLEAHHLEPLAKGGADSPRNLVVLSPLVHKMLHYADVTGLNLENVVDGKLNIKINGEDFTITWHPAHAETISKFEET